MKEIVLGLFSNDFELYKLENRNVEDFPFGRILKDYPINGLGVIDIVEVALRKCDICHFIIDGIRFPLFDECLGHSYTTKELDLILSNPEFANKTKFITNEFITGFKEVDLRTYYRQKCGIYQDRKYWMHLCRHISKEPIESRVEEDQYDDIPF